MPLKPMPMLESQVFYTLRCAKCSCHFSSILELNGLMKLEKKCPKCKAVNVFTISNKEIDIQCKITDDRSSDNNGFAADNEYWEGNKN